MRIMNLLSLKRSCKISKSAKIFPFCILSNTNIGSYSYVSYNCKINNTTIGKFCSIARGVQMGLGKHPTNFISTNPLLYSMNNPFKMALVDRQVYSEFSPIVIGNDVWIGTNAIILDNVKIGDGAIIAANSVVTKDVESYTIVGGVPAKLIKKRFKLDIIIQLLKLKWWNFPIEKLKKKSVLNLFSGEVNTEVLVKLSKILKEK